MMFRRIGGHAVRCSHRISSTRLQLCNRKFSAQAIPTTTYSASSSPLGGLTVELDRIAPRFEVQPSHIQILNSPTSFYETLKARNVTLDAKIFKLTKSQRKIRGAKKRIYLSTLYIGKTEFELIATLNESLHRNPNLKVSILTDALRGTRETPDPSCASLLASLVAEHGPKRVEIRMFHTPNLTGLRKRWIPKRINEGWGLQHMKLYGIDDEIILSGCEIRPRASLGCR
jgi:CDP-diacylglycerol--glycerol-3-phosphate 3-phosphatidyltransferase